MKVAIIGSREYENSRKIKDTLTELKKKFREDLIIISGGAQYGADKFVRKNIRNINITSFMNYRGN